MEEGKIADTPKKLREYIDCDSDEEISDELINVRLKNFDDLRKLAAAAGMSDRYVFFYQPESTIIHGHWPALRKYCLELCKEPLHRLHLQPSFDLPLLNPFLLFSAFDFFAEAYDLWISHYKLGNLLSPLIDEYFEECDRSIGEAFHRYRMSRLTAASNNHSLPILPKDRSQRTSNFAYRTVTFYSLQDRGH